MRFAGTCSRYSNRAMPQLTSAATTHGRVFNSFRCPYQAKVMKTFDRHSSTTVCSNTMPLLKDVPLRGQNRPSFVIPPAATDLQVTRRVPFELESAITSQRDGGPIPRLDVGFEAMQFQRSEGLGRDGLQTRTHEATPLLPRECVVAEIAAAERTHDDIGQVDDAGDRAGVATAHQIGVIGRLGHALHVGLKI